MKAYIVYKLLYYVHLFFTVCFSPYHYVCIVKCLLQVHRGAAAGVGPGEQCPQHQEGEGERQAAGHGAYGWQRGGVCGLGLAAAAWARGVSLLPEGPCWSGWHFAGALSSLSLTHRTNFFALGLRVWRGGCGAQLAPWRQELAGGWGKRVHAADLACLESKLANLHPEEKYKHTLSHKLATHLAGLWNLYLEAGEFWWWIL